MQSPFDVHLPHAPLGAQYGLPAVGHGLGSPEPLSLPQMTHRSPALHTGVVPVHALPLVGVHWTHAFVLGSHAGVTPPQFESPLHCSHRPLFGPDVAHTLDRQTVPPFAPVHGPSPLR